MSNTWWRSLDQRTKQRIQLGLRIGGALSLGYAAYCFFNAQQAEKNGSSCCQASRTNSASKAKKQAVSCCGGGGGGTGNTCNINESERKEEDDTNIKQLVNERYSATVRSFDSGTQQKSADLMAMKFGYTKEELQEFGSDGSNMGLSCGNPVAMASIKLNETIVDLGSGGGFDCFIASKKVGINGKVIGIDMSDDMIAKAKANAQKRNYTNCQFYKAEIENMPLKVE